MLTLRPATDADSWFFFSLRNEPTAVRMSRRGVITPAEHDLWWRTTSDLRYVAEVDGREVGTLRVAADGTVSIVVAATERGNGWGTRMLEDVVPRAREAGITRLFAEVAPENERSQRAFLRAGWKPVLFERGTGAV